MALPIASTAAREPADFVVVVDVDLHLALAAL